MKQLYIYAGPVMEFDTCIANNWEGSTWAVSEKKAKSNLTYQFKKQHNRSADSNIRLTGKIMLLDEAAAA